MSVVVEQLQLMRARVPMYVGSNCLYRLAAFIRGYKFAAEQLGDKGDDFLSEFQQWVRERYAVTISKAWEDIISFNTNSDEDAMKLFWELFDAYLNEKKASAQ